MTLHNSIDEIVVIDGQEKGKGDLQLAIFLFVHISWGGHLSSFLEFHFTF